MAMPTGGGGSPFDMAKLREMLDDPAIKEMAEQISSCLLYTSPSPRDS